MTPNTKNDRITKLIHYSMENDSSSFCFLHLARFSFSHLPFVSVPFFFFLSFFPLFLFLSQLPTPPFLYLSNCNIATTTTDQIKKY
ncbi:hypothetical protein BDV24DRAFT_7447 [Aspergillus arachidicola]|uniref:Uncharacterized protein n=1 Tax=Aspergillus arachidicola TaxID=656916 RepID=A0A5N6XVC2_9EURO|nr:hypothetical protein BDV24DRAFT_7447 [Aspergillus arachidicola]